MQGGGQIALPRGVEAGLDFGGDLGIRPGGGFVTKMREGDGDWRLVVAVDLE